jgi:DNA mismatch repair protein MutS2
LAVGGTVRHRGLGWTGVLEKLEDGRAEVVVRGKRVRCRPEELAPSGPENRAARKERERETRTVPGLPVRSGGDIEESVSPEINLIGMRVEPALEQLDSYLDQALLASRKEVRVIHGHGSGRLRQAVREHLRGHRGIAGIRSGAPNEGGDGATVVTFRGA